jgi:hypothetical protein
VAGAGKAFSPAIKGLNSELYNPPYFDFCRWSETLNGLPTVRPSCIEPIYGHGCLDAGSILYNAPVAFYSNVYAHVRPELPDGSGVAARSVYLGFEPYYFKTPQIKALFEKILSEEFQLSID